MFEHKNNNPEPKRRFTLAQDGFVGGFYSGNRREKKAVIFVGGAQCNYRMTLTMGSYLVDAGFNVLFLSFYLWGGLPKEMWHIPVDYAERAAWWLSEQGYERIAELFCLSVSWRGLSIFQI